MRGAAVALLLIASAVGATEPFFAITPFSAAPGEGLPGEWKERFVQRVAPSRIAIVEDEGARVLQVSSQDSAGAASLAVRDQWTEGTALAWRWKVDRVVAAAAMDRKDGDDFAARVYVFFDVPYESLPWTTRLKMRVARLLYGEVLPTAGICYVWDNRHAPGTSRWSPYTDRIRIVVVEGGASRAGAWTPVRRDLAKDFREAFGEQWRGTLPAITGIAAGNDTDQTGESATARFADFRFEAAR